MTDSTSRQTVPDTVPAPESRAACVRKRDGRVVTFEGDRIRVAIEKAFRADRGLGPNQPFDEVTATMVRKITDAVIEQFLDRMRAGRPLDIEEIQDAVETELMREGYYSVARRYIVYREERKRARVLKGEGDLHGESPTPFFIRSKNGKREQLDFAAIRKSIGDACAGVEDRCSGELIEEEVMKSVYNDMSTDDMGQAMVLAARSHIETETTYSYVAARLLLQKIYREVWQESVAEEEWERTYRAALVPYIEKAIDLELLSPELRHFDLEQLAGALRLERDRHFTYMGLQTLYDRYLLHDQDRRLETPQYFWMRVAMGLALREGEEAEARAIEFYEVLSSFHFVSSTPTLFNAGTLHPQLSSCYLSTIMDDLEHIFKVVSDDAKLSKWAGGLGNDWTNVRATGAHIKGTNGKSQGVVPFLKVANDTAVAVNQGGKRKGAMCAYLETWHLDIEDFLELRKNTGDERRRTHDMNTANWIPDLFMKRVREQGTWTLFNPSEVPDLHDLSGRAFEERYQEYEAMAERGALKLFKKVDAVRLWRKMLTMLYETGHPWLTFKDPSNIRSPQSHAGVVHSSNLCTEILLNTSKDETAVCNLGSINLAAHTTSAGLDESRLAKTIRTAVRMLDNVIDINFYPTPETRRANLRHRPIGLGIMGFQDALYKQHIGYASDEAVTFADRSMERIAYYAILASTELAAERGAYQSFPGSKWSQGLLPIDTIDLLERERDGHVDMNRDTTMDWERVREAVKRHGMRNSNTMAIAPTATISNITGVAQSIEPTYKHLYAKSNLSGEFTAVNQYLVEELKMLNLWDAQMLEDLKYYDGSIQEIDRIPERIKAVYRTAFEIDPLWLIECASRRQKWIDMGQSLNLYIAEPSGQKLSEMYTKAWGKGLKTTYYLRALGATQVEKSTLDVNRRGIQPRWMKNRSASSHIQVDRGQTPDACRVDDPECEACQ